MDDSRNQRFVAFYEASFGSVLAAVRAFCGDGEMAFEATQEAFARAYSRWGRVAEANHPQAWVTKTAINHTRRMSRRRHLSSSNTSTSEGPTPDRLDVVEALRGLPDRQRQAVVLHYLADCPVTVVAEVMGISEGAVKSHLFKARASLKSVLEVGHA